MVLSPGPRALAAVLICLACSQVASAQISWQKAEGNPIVPAGVGAGYAFNPAVLVDNPAKLYRMWFQAQSYAVGWSVFAAISEDGVSWYTFADNPVLEAGTAQFETDGVASCDVIRVGSEYRIYYTGLEGCCRSSIGLATSTDGLHWTRYAGNPVLQPSATGWDAETLSGPRVIRDGSRYLMYYRGNGGGSVQTGLAVSNDGITWTKDPRNPVLPLGGSGSWDQSGTEPGGVFVDHGMFHMFYNGASPGSPEAVGLATSPDGVTWQKLTGNPVLTGGGPGSWDGNVAAGSVIVEQRVTKLWYSGNPVGGHDWSIGLATAALPSVIELTPTQPALLHARPNPFVSETQIQYALARPGPVSLRVYDLLGREVAVLADGAREAGTYNERWDASRMDAGVYFCDLRANGSSQITKLMVVK